MELIKGFQKSNLTKNPISLYNSLMGQLDSNFRKIEKTVNDLGMGISDVKSARVGSAVLVGGTIAVLDVKIKNSSKIFLCCNVTGGTVGFLYISARSEGVSFTITSSSGTDTSTVSYLIIDVD